MKKITKRNRHVAHRVLAKAPAPEELAKEPHKKTKPHEDWWVNGIAVSDHAVVRFLEICGGLDMKAVRVAIVEGREKLIKLNRFCKLPIDSRGKLVVNNGVVVTILKNKYPGK